MQIHVTCGNRTELGVKNVLEVGRDSRHEAAAAGSCFSLRTGGNCSPPGSVQTLQSTCSNVIAHIFFILVPITRCLLGAEEF